MKPARKLTLVRPVEDEPPDVSYESAQRRHIMSRDWAAVHVAADRRTAINLTECVRRVWR